MQTLKSQLLRWFVPADLQAAPRTRRQALQTVVFGLAMAFWAPCLHRSTK